MEQQEEQGRKGKRNPLWIIGAAVVFILSKFKLVLALLKFGKFGGALISMFVSIGAYALLFPFQFAIGLVIMLLIHETGHVIAAKQKNLPVSAPIFIPFLGALITMKKHPRDAETEAYVAMGGPLLGTLGAIIAFAAGWYWDSQLLLSIAYIGVFLNLINLLPIHPLDGGRIATAVSRWLWLIGLVGGLIVIVYLKSILFFIIWALFAWDLYKKYVKNRNKKEQYQLSPRFEMAVAPLLLQGIMLPGEEHKRPLPFTTYSDRQGNQSVAIEWDGIGLHQIIKLPRQGIIHGVYVDGLEYQGQGEERKMIVRCRVAWELHEDDAYYRVSVPTRWKFGVSYGLLAIVLFYMLYLIQDIGLP